MRHGIQQSTALLLSVKDVGNARLGESDLHPISPKTPASQYVGILELGFWDRMSIHIDTKKRKDKKSEDKNE